MNYFGDGQRESLVSTKFFAHFMVGLTSGGAVLAMQADSYISVQSFLDQGVKELVKREQITDSVAISAGCHNAGVFGFDCASEAANDGLAEIDDGIVNKVKGLICPLDPFC
jgi:hypothetical protein